MLCWLLCSKNSLDGRTSLVPIESSFENSFIKITSISSRDHPTHLSNAGYKSIERRDFSIDSKTESVYRQFTGSSSLSKEFSLGSISNQNISLCSSNSINLDVKNYKNQHSIKEEPEDSAEQKITFVWIGRIRFFQQLARLPADENI